MVFGNNNPWYTDIHVRYLGTDHYGKSGAQIACWYESKATTCWNVQICFEWNYRKTGSWSLINFHVMETDIRWTLVLPNKTSFRYTVYPVLSELDIIVNRPSVLLPSWPREPSLFSRTFLLTKSLRPNNPLQMAWRRVHHPAQIVNFRALQPQMNTYPWTRKMSTRSPENVQGQLLCPRNVKLLSSLTNPPHIWPSRPPKALNSPRNARQAQKANRAKRSTKRERQSDPLGKPLDEGHIKCPSFHD